MIKQTCNTAHACTHTTTVASTCDESLSLRQMMWLSFHYMRTRFTLHDAFTWWRHQMEIFSALLALCAGNSPVPVNSPHKGQWRGALMFCLICARIDDWVNNREAGDLRRHRGHYDVIVMRKMETWEIHASYSEVRRGCSLQPTISMKINSQHL